MNEKFDQVSRVINPKLAMVSQNKHIPINFMYETTYRCNLKCIHCYNAPTKDGMPELSTEEAGDALQQLAEAGCIQISLSGGEFFMRGDWYMLLKKIRSLNFAINILTNGLLLDDDAIEKVAEIRPWQVSFSIYGATGETHDAVTGARGSLEKTLRAVRIVRDKGIKTQIKCVVMDSNAREYRKIKELADSLDVKYILDTLVVPKADGTPGPTKYRVPLKVLKEILSDQELDRSAVHFGTMENVESAAVHLDSVMCKAGINYGHLDPYGNISPCVLFPVKAGNIREKPFIEIWKDAPIFKRIRKTRMKDVKKCGECELISHCFRCPGIAYLENHDAFGPSDYCCEVAKIKKEISDEKIGS